MHHDSLWRETARTPSWTYAVETSGIEEVITTLQVIKTALEAGGLDAQIEALTSKSSKVAEVVQTKRPILGLKK